MLVPAMTFAWWLVSMSAPTHTRGATDGTLPTAEASAATDQQDIDEVTPADTTGGGASGADESTDTAEETTGARVTLKVVTPAIVKVAKTLLDLPMGAERSIDVDGRRYVFVLERHYHPPGFVGGPHGWHKGVTVYGLP